MADTSNLTNFLGDIANAIRTKKETTEQIPAENFDQEILSIETGIDTSDATATASDILNPKTAYTNGHKITGSIFPMYKPGEITGIEINNTAASNYGISFLLPDNNTMMFINKSTAYLKLSNGEIISRNIDLGNYYPHQAEISELPYEDNKYYFAICSYSSATQSSSNKARIDIFSIDLSVLSTSAYDIELEPIKTLSGLYMSYNQGCFTFAKQNGNILAYMERNTTHNLVSIYEISTDSYFVLSKDLGYRELDPNFLKFMNNDRLLVSYVTGYNYNWIFNLTNYTIDSYKLLSKNTKISTLDGVNYFYSYSNTDTSKNELHYGTYDLTNGATTSVASTSFSTNILDVNILYKNENIYCVGVYCDNNMYLLKYDANTNLFTVLKNTNGYGLIKENTVLSYGYSISLHSIWSGKENVTSGLTVNVELTDRIASLTKENIKYYDTSDATATANDIVSGKTAYNNQGIVKGSMPNNGELNYTPSTEEQIIPAGYTSGGIITASPVSQEEYDKCVQYTSVIATGRTIEFLNYIKSSGSQRIDLGIKYTPTTKIVLDIKPVGSRNWQMFMSDGGNNDSHLFALQDCTQNNNGGFDVWLNNETVRLRYNINQRLTIVFDRNKFYINDTLYKTFNSDTWDIPNNITLFNNSTMSLYNCKVYDNDILIMDLHPAVDTLDNNPTLFDIVSNNFISNSGTGKFIGG